MKYRIKYTLEDLLTNESFLNYYFQKNENDMLDWEEWTNENTQNKALAAQAFHLLDKFSLKWDETQIKEKLKLLTDKLNPLSEEEEYRTTSKVYQIANNYSFMRWMAAAFIVFGSIGAMLWLSKNKNIAPTNNIVLYENQNTNKVSLFTLLDGTKIRLKANSSFRLDENFGKTTREVYLSGEAFFDVAHDANHPFMVHTGNLTTTALGTAFNICAYANDKEIKVSLVRGKVKVETKLETKPTKEIITLIPGEQVRLNVEKKALMPIEKFNIQAASAAWQEEIPIKFDKTPFAEVVVVLEKKYNVRFVGINDAQAKSRITGEFEATMTLDEILEVLAFANNFKYNISNEMVTINQ